MTHELRSLWRICEASHPDDPLPLLALADKLKERGYKNDLSTAYALEWMAENHQRPCKHPEIKGSWFWRTDFNHTVKGQVIPLGIYITVKGQRFRSWRIAVRSLGKALIQVLRNSLLSRLWSGLGLE